MFQRELNQAALWGERLLTSLRAASDSPRTAEVAKELTCALEAAWRMESSLGQFLAVEEQKLRAMGMLETASLARQAFDALKPCLLAAGKVLLRPEAEMKGWIEDFVPRVERAVEVVRKAQRGMPLVKSHRIDAPVGEARPESAQATVSIAQTDCPNLDVEGVADLARRALEPLGGIEAFIRPGQTVLLKPNQTLWLLADEGGTTDPRLVGALTRLSFEAGAARVVVGESSGGGSASDYVMEVTGVKLMARREGAEVVDFHSCEQREVDLPQGKLIKRIALPVPLLEADAVINLPKMKTHNWDWISGALKNWVGIVNPIVREQHHDADTFDEYTDLLFQVRPTLNVMDAIVRGVGNGPGANTGEFYGAILASIDPVAMDSVAAQLLGFDPSSIGFVQVAADRGLGVGDPHRIAVVGVPLSQAFRPAKPPEMGVDMYEANVIVGTGITRAGTLGHFKSMADVFYAMGTWGLVQRLHGTPTILIGDAEDPLFEDHLEAGPYIVIDDAAPEQYKHHPKPFFIPGHPVLHNLESLLPEGLRIPRLGRLALGVMGKTRTLDSRLEFNSPRPVVPLVRAALGVSRRLTVPFQVAGTIALLSTLTLGLSLGLRYLLLTRPKG